MENKSPAFQWYPKDILASARVQQMTLAEEGAYRRLIDYCWINGSIPADAQKAARLIGKGASIEIAMTVLDMFSPHPDDPDKMIHDRLEIERAKQKHNSEARQKAAEARWKGRGKSVNGNGKQVESKSNANALQTDMQNDALHIATTYSVSNETGETPISEIWDVGLNMLKKKGMKDKEARSFLGKMRSTYKDELLIECILHTQEQQPINPQEYLVGALKKRQKKDDVPLPSDDELQKQREAYRQQAREANV